jgi:hypothetical protein
MNKKSLIILSVILIFTMALTACGNGGGSPSGQTAEPNAAAGLSTEAEPSTASEVSPAEASGGYTIGYDIYFVGNT